MRVCNIEGNFRRKTVKGQSEPQKIKTGQTGNYTYKGKIRPTEDRIKLREIVAASTVSVHRKWVKNGSAAGSLSSEQNFLLTH
jgi:hypothetical protein